MFDPSSTLTFLSQTIRSGWCVGSDGCFSLIKKDLM